MRLSGEEYLRVSHLIQLVRPSTTARTANLATAPARSSAAPASSRASSMEATDVQYVLRSIAQQPEVRDEIIASLRARIESGTYQVSGEQIGEMMIRRLLADRVS